MPSFIPKEDAIISLKMDYDFSEVDDSTPETYESTWAKNGVASAMIVMREMPTTEQLIQDWIVPPTLTALLPKDGFLAKLAQALYHIPFNWLRNFIQPYAFNAIVIEGMTRSKPYQDVDGNWIISFHKD